MSGWQYFVNCWTKNYVNFEGRARRSEFWYFVLFNALIAYTLAGIGFAIAGASESPIGLIPYGLYILASILPSLGVAVRRLHDIGKSGWTYLLALIPLVGGIILIVFFATDSQVGTNKWGPNPKNPVGDLEASDHLIIE